MVEPATNRIWRGQMLVRLRPRVMNLLLALAECPGEVISKQALVDLVWPRSFIADNTVTHAVQELRAALGDDATAPRYIETVHRRGYRLIPKPANAVASDKEQLLEGVRFALVTNDRQILLVDGENIFGRGNDTQILLDSKKVSRHHARIVVTPEGAFVEDLGSKNGTFLDGTRVQGSTPLSHGSRLRIGGMLFVFCSHGTDRTTSIDLDRS